MKLIGLDVGDRRIGIAFGDATLRLATPVDVVERTSVEQDARTIAGFVRDYDAERVIVGLPRNMDGTIGPQAQSTQAYVARIASSIPVPVQFWDEQLTTVEATQRTQESRSKRGKKGRRGLDAIAAAVILQDYMDAQANETQERTD